MIIIRNRILAVSCWTLACLVCTEVDASELGAWPTVNRVISSGFGPRIKTSSGNRFDFHRGIDIPGNSGDDIYAIADGIVDGIFPVGSATYPRGGNVVRIRHENSKGLYFSLYLHLSSFAVNEGQRLVRGQKIGGLGRTGDTTFDHLHFEILELTPCSLESQLAGFCTLTATGKDPHQNPLAYLQSSNLKAPSLEITAQNPLTIKVSVDAEELDLNRIQLEASPNRFLTIDYNKRTGLDATSNANLDRETTTDDITISPAIFNSASFENNQAFETIFTFNAQNNYRSIKVVDLWGNERLLINPNAPPLGELVSPAMHYLLLEGDG